MWVCTYTIWKLNFCASICLCPILLSDKTEYCSNISAPGCSEPHRGKLVAGGEVDHQIESPGRENFLKCQMRIIDHL